MFSDSLFAPYAFKSLDLKNRIVMSPMTREFSFHGVPGPEVATYYRRRAKGQVGLVLTEGAAIERPAATNSPRVPHFYGEPALTAWGHVAEAVHEAGGMVGPLLSHVGIAANHPSGWRPPAPLEGPAAVRTPGQLGGQAMTLAAVEATCAAFGQAAADAQQLGFDCVVVDGAHGCLLDQFFRAATNTRTDAYGGPSLAERGRLAAEVVREVRRRVGHDFIISLSISQVTPLDYSVKLAATPQELEVWLAPLAAAGVDIFHCPQRHCWAPEFASTGSDLNFAGWVKKLTGKATITAGAVGLLNAAVAGFPYKNAVQRSLEDVQRRLARQEFDLIAVGRALLADHYWAVKVQQGRWHELADFRPEMLHTLQ